VSGSTASPAPHMRTIKKKLCIGIEHPMLYACMKSIFLIILIMCGAGDNVKLVIFCTCFLTREMLVQLVNFENGTSLYKRGSARMGLCLLLM
jgi:hypothetical protein